MTYNSYTKQVLKKPASVHEIRQALLDLQGSSVFLQSIQLAATKDISGCLLMILSQAGEHRALVAHIIGEDLLTKIENL